MESARGEYSGEWRNGKKNGTGTYSGHNGELYVGERIRDFTTAANGKLFLAGDLGSLIIINRTDQDIP